MAIRLPHADGLEFYWTDGTMDSVRYVSEYGEFYFRAMNGTCREGVFTIEPDEDCERQECIVSIPNAVSPNGDGINEDLRLYAPGCSTIRSARLLDKWGNILYRSSVEMDGISLLIPAEAWQDLAPGLYVLAVDYEDGQGRMKNEWGPVTVIR